MKKTAKSTRTRKAAKKASPAKRTKSTEPKLDAWGFEVGTSQADVNKLLRTKPQTVREMADASGINHRRIRYQCRVLHRMKLVKRTDDGYAWARKK